MESPTDAATPSPYQPPSAQLADTEHQRQLAGSLPDPGIIKSFRQQIHALGALWIILGGLALLVMALMLGNGNQMNAPRMDAQLQMITIGAMGAAWLLLGVFTCLKQIWAVYVGLTLSYLSAIGQLFSLNLCGLAIMAVVILQAHRVIGWANKMRAAGIPLTTKA